MIDAETLFTQDDVDAIVGKRLARHRLHRTDQAKATLAAADDVKAAHEQENPPGYLGGTPTAIPPADAAHMVASGRCHEKGENHG